MVNPILNCCHQGDDSFNDFAALLVSDFEQGKMPRLTEGDDFESEFKRWIKELGKKTG